MLVFGLLAGLLGMHALAPATAAPHGHQGPVGDTAHGHRAAAGVTAPAHCAGAGDCGGSGHVHHVDPACASAALDGPPVPAGRAAAPCRPGGMFRHPRAFPIPQEFHDEDDPFRPAPPRTGRGSRRLGGAAGRLRQQRQRRPRGAQLPFPARRFAARLGPVRCAQRR
ncbi:DUF6153 family protein [Streptomyces lydicus]|uniref:DUF6153 family protein n=1 Tax=Streptomyces lydicus TaxID=47763 RepID=UPI0037BC2329